MPGNSGEAQILEYDGTLYVINGANDVFALSVDTGKILWSYRGQSRAKGGQSFRPREPRRCYR